MIKRMKALQDGCREIWLAGGCFWGTQAYLNNINGTTWIVKENPGY